MFLVILKNKEKKKIYKRKKEIKKFRQLPLQILAKTEGKNGRI